MEPPRFDFIHDLLPDEPTLEAEAQARFLAYLELVDRIAIRLCREEEAEDSAV